MIEIRPTLTINDTKRLAHCRRERVEQALATGALRAAVLNPDRRGRTPRALILADEALRWIGAGMPTTPGGAA